MKDDKPRNVTFRRIGGKVVPITVKAGGSGGGLEVKLGQSKRGPYKTKLDRRNEQRRERYAIRKKVKAEIEAKKRKESLFGIKGLSTENILGAAGAASTAFLAIRTGRAKFVSGIGKVATSEASKAMVKNKLRLVKKMRADIGPSLSRMDRMFESLKKSPQFSPRAWASGDFMGVTKKRVGRAAYKGGSLHGEISKLARDYERYMHVARSVKSSQDTMRRTIYGPGMEKVHAGRKRLKQLRNINRRYGNAFDLVGAGTVGGTMFYSSWKADQ